MAGFLHQKKKFEILDTQTVKHSFHVETYEEKVLEPVNVQVSMKNWILITLFLHRWSKNHQV